MGTRKNKKVIDKSKKVCYNKYIKRKKEVMNMTENLTMFVAISTAAVFTLLGLGLCPSKDK